MHNMHMLHVHVHVHVAATVQEGIFYKETSTSSLPRTHCFGHGQRLRARVFGQWAW